MSNSTQTREQGNRLYNAAMTPGLERSLRKQRFEEALQCFQEAANQSYTPHELSSAAMNVEQAAWKLVMVQGEDGLPLESVRKSFVLAFSNFFKAKGSGREKSAAWHSALQEAERGVLESALEYSKQLANGPERAWFLYKIVGLLQDGAVKADGYFAMAQTLFHHSVRVLQEQDYASALSLLHDCHFPIEEAAMRYRSDPAKMEEVEVLRNDIITHMLIAEALQAMETGMYFGQRTYWYRLLQYLDQEHTVNVDIFVLYIFSCNLGFLNICKNAYRENYINNSLNSQMYWKREFVNTRNCHCSKFRKNSFTRKYLCSQYCLL